MTFILFVLLVASLVYSGVQKVKANRLINRKNSYIATLETKNESLQDFQINSNIKIRDLQAEVKYLNENKTGSVVNNFTGLVSNTKNETKKILEALDVAGSRRYDEAEKKANEDLDSIIKASQAATKAAKAYKPTPTKRSSSSDSSLPLYTPSVFDSGSSYSSGSSSSSSSSCGSSSSSYSSSSSDSGSSSSGGGCD